MPDSFCARDAPITILFSEDIRLRLEILVYCFLISYYSPCVTIKKKYFIIMVCNENINIEKLQVLSFILIPLIRRYPFSQIREKGHRLINGIKIKDKTCNFSNK
ncbi:hypothetical protein Hanom_Chr01g00091451 [Helianthus anomalus]